MTGEIAHIVTDNIVMDNARFIGEHGLDYAKAAGSAIVGAGALVGGMLIRNHFSKPSDGIGKDGRVRFVDQGYIGLRERNRQFYRSVPMYDAFEPEAEPLYYNREFYELVLPGFVIAPHPWRKYKLLNTQSQTMPFKFENTQVADKKGRLHNIAGNFTWGHITGVDGDRQPLQYAYLHDSEKHAAGPVSIEQLIYNGIIAAKHQAELGEQVRSILEPVVLERLYGAKNPVKKAWELFDSVEMAVHDDLLDIGTELRQVKPVVSPHIFGHLAATGEGIVSKDKQLELAAVQQIGSSHPGVGFAPAATIHS